MEVTHHKTADLKKQYHGNMTSNTKKTCNQKRIIRLDLWNKLGLLQKIESGYWDITNEHVNNKNETIVVVLSKYKGRLENWIWYMLCFNGDITVWYCQVLPKSQMLETNFSLTTSTHSMWCNWNVCER